MPALTTIAENRTLNWLTRQGTANDFAPAVGLEVRLMITNGDDDTNGTEVVGGGYVRQLVTFGAAANGQCSNTNVIRFDNMPDISGATFVRGFEIWDRHATTPQRWWHAPLTTPRQYQAGDAAEFPVNELVLAMD
jgi:hypothetical protein